MHPIIVTILCIQNAYYYQVSMSALYIHITDGVEGFTDYPECVMYYVIRLTES